MTTSRTYQLLFRFYLRVRAEISLHFLDASLPPYVLQGRTRSCHPRHSPSYASGSTRSHRQPLAPDLLLPLAQRDEFISARTLSTESIRLVGATVEPSTWQTGALPPHVVQLVDFTIPSIISRHRKDLVLSYRPNNTQNRVPANPT